MSKATLEVLEMTAYTLFDGIIYIVFDDKCITIYAQPEFSPPITFEKALDIAKENGYEEGVIYMICEGGSSGDVYKYGNYNDGKWYRVGKTCGYA